MKIWQKIWLKILIVFFLLHIIRDIFQDLGIENFLSTFLVSPGPPKITSFIYWTIFNTYTIAGIEIILALICLRRNYFGKLGKATIIIAFISFILWLIYYFYL